jgi:hypothetical protein
MRRNVFFKECRAVPELPFSSLDSQAPEDLWAWMDGQRKAGHELLRERRRVHRGPRALMAFVVEKAAA